MARRYTAADEPMSRLAIWARRMALFSLCAVIVSIIIVRSELLDIRPAITTFVVALAPSIFALLLAVGAFVVIWTDGLRGLGRTFAAIAIAGAILAYPAYLSYRAYKLPWLYDITTDPLDPPRYEALARLRPREANPIAYAGLYAAEQQRAAYPDIEPLDEDATPEVAFKAALAVITKRKWIIIDRRPPQPSRPEGHIEAVARTLIMGLRDDVGDSGARRSGRIAHRCAFVLALRLLRFRQQCDARARPDRRYRHRDRQREAGTGRAAGEETAAGAAHEKRSERERSPRHRQAVAPIDRGRALRRDQAARAEILQMRQDRKPGRLGEPRIEPDIDRSHQRRDVGFAGGEALEDRRLAGAAVRDVLLHETRRIPHRATVAWKVQRLRPAAELLERRHIIAHGANRAAPRSGSTRP